MRLVFSAIVILLFVYSIIPPIWPKQDDVSAIVFFCPETDCMALFESAVRQAKKSIHCALYDFSDRLLPLFDSRDGIDISIVHDAKNSMPPRSYLHPKKSSSLSHNKFCIFDRQFVWTGSFNPTGNKNRNDVLLFSSRYLAENYETELQELLGGKQRQTPYTLITSANMTLENYFCPDDSCEQKVLDAISKAEKSIYVMAYSFTHPAVSALLLAKKDEGIDVHVLLEARQIDERSAYDILHQSIPVSISNKEGLLHYKAFIIDNETVITGSANPTRNGYYHNDENILILANPSLAVQYSARFIEESHGALLRKKAG